MKTAVTGEEADGHIIYNRSLLALAQHYGYLPRACRPYRAKTKGKVERPFSYIRQDFFLARSFRDLDDLNAQLRTWLDTVANIRLHGTTQRVVAEAFATERADLQPLPAVPFDALLKLERRVSHDGFVSIGGNYYSVPDRTRRVVEVHQQVDRASAFEVNEEGAVGPSLADGPIVDADGSWWFRTRQWEAVQEAQHRIGAGPHPQVTGQACTGLRARCKPDRVWA